MKSKCIMNIVHVTGTDVQDYLSTKTIKKSSDYNMFFNQHTTTHSSIPTSRITKD